MRLDVRVYLLSLHLAALAMAIGVRQPVRALGGDERAAGTSPVSPRVRTVSDLFARRCARCHDSDGSGAALRSTMPALPNFTNSHWQEDRRTPQLVVSILEGRGRQMPPFGGRISRQEAHALVEYIRSLAPVNAVSADDVPPLEFHERFRELQEEFEHLRKQFRDLATKK
jgi:mono/diheme cytochrome c family protein